MTKAERRDQLQRFIRENQNWIEQQREKPVETVQDWMSAEFLHRRRAINEAQQELRRL